MRNATLGHILPLDLHIYPYKVLLTHTVVPAEYSQHQHSTLLACTTSSERRYSEKNFLLRRGKTITQGIRKRKMVAFDAQRMVKYLKNAITPIRDIGLFYQSMRKK